MRKNHADTYLLAHRFFIPRITMALLLICTAACGVLSGCTHRYSPTPKINQQITDPNLVQDFPGLHISPDGSLIAYIRYFDHHVYLITQKLSDSSLSYHTLSDSDDISVSSLEWSHKGNRLGIITQGANDFSLHILEGDTYTELTKSPGIGSQIHWSPDDKYLSALTIAHPHKRPGATAEGVQQIGVITDAFDARRIAVIELDNNRPIGSFHEISSDKTYVYEYQWKKDNSGFVVISANGNGDANWWVATINSIDVVSGAAQVLDRPTMQVASITVSPDGSSYAVIGGLMSDEIAVGGDVYTGSINGGALTNLTPNSTTTYLDISWKTPGIYATVQNGVQQELDVIHPIPTTTSSATTTTPSSTASSTTPPAKIETKWNFGTTDGRINVDDAGDAIASVRESFTTPPEIYAGAPGKITAITHNNSNFSAAISAQPVSWSNQGFHLTGWLLSPLKASSGLHPLLVDVHGGPAADQEMGMGYIREDSNWLDYKLIHKGYYIFLPNPRGSYGHGEHFTRANYRDFGGGDLRDILAGIDQVERIAPVDDNKLAITGVSYGGYMAMMAPARSHRFKASIAGAGISDFFSYYGENGISTWLVPYFGASAYDDPQIYRAISPLTYIKSYTTPTLIYVGEGDIECPPPQSMELFRALQNRHVPTQLIIYPHEGHGIWRVPANVQDLLQREINWLDKYIQ